ncbi:MAG: DUF4394 domain-containing protein [Planctomycetota bacterium]
MQVRRFAAASAAMLSLCAGTTLAQDWGVISTVGDPDPVTGFDLADPIGSQVSLGFVDGNFNRGMDFDSPNSFYYYVSTDILNDPGDRGLWRFDNGVNTQLFEAPFEDSGDGDASLSADGSTFYVSVDDDDGIGGDSLYAFTNLNGTPSFTEIGETGLSQLIGIAVHPTTGVLYGYDSDTEALYTISTADGSATLVGASNEDLAAIGGMDFNADGSTLLLADNGTELFTVDINTGALTSAGDPGLNISALSFRVPTPGTVSLALGATLIAARRRRG